MGTGGAGSGGGFDLEEIRRRADMVEIVSAHVVLRKVGQRLTGLCPFHKERTPSFTLDPETGLWHCFGCKAGGDLFRFVEMIEKVSFTEAAELLARRLGVQPRRPAEAARQRQRERLLALHEEAARFFESCLRADATLRSSDASSLRSTRAARPARDYLTRRGLSAQTIKDFRLGYAPGTWDALLKAMSKRGYTSEELARAGLAVAGNRPEAGPGARPRDRAPTEETRFWDRFRDRIVFPIWDASGRVIAFGGRALQDDQQPKYLNSPETALFQKGRTLYAFDRARKAMGEAGRAIIVEGYLDAIACHDAGFAEAVATMGTALTSEHVEMLRRRVPELVLAFDADSAGLAAALRGRELFQQAGLRVRVVSLPEGADPDRVVRDQGGEAFRELVSAAKPMTEWELTRILSPGEGQSEAQGLEVLREAVAALARLPAGVEREYYTRWLVQQSGAESAEGIGAVEASVRAELARLGGLEARRPASARRKEAPSQERGDASESVSPQSAPGRIQLAVLAAFVQYGELAVRYGTELEAADFATEEQQSVFRAIGRLVEREEPVTAAAVLAEIEPEARGLLAQLAVAPVPERSEDDVQRSIRRLLEDRLRRQETMLKKRQEGAGSPEEEAAIERELFDRRRRRKELGGERIVGED
jgi:DNA primase